MLSSRLTELRQWLEARPLWRGGMLLLLASILVYAGMPAEELTFDNGIIVGEDTRLRSFDAGSVQEIVQNNYWWPTLASSLYRPLTTFSFWIEYSFLGYGETPFGYQLNNLLLNLGNALLVILLARRMGLASAAAVVVAGIVALHPITVEVVANIVGRADLFACAAVVGGLLCYLRSTDGGTGVERVKWMGACGLCAFVGVLSKESAVALPVLVVWHGCCRVGELRDPATRGLWWADAGRAVLCLLPSVVFLVLVRRHFSNAIPGLSDHPFIDNPLMAEGRLVSLLSAFGVWGMEIHSLFLPLSLSSDYSFDAIPVADWASANRTFWWGLGTMAVFAVVPLGLLVFRRRLPANLVFLLGAYFIAALPTSNVLIKIGSVRADRFHYLPGVFLWIGLALVLKCLLQRVSRADRETGLVVRTRFSWVVGAWCVCLVLLAHLRCYDWRSNLTLWQSALENAPGSVKSQAAVANERLRVRENAETALEAMERIEAALAPYREKNVDPADWPLILFSDYGAFATSLHDDLSRDPLRKEEAKTHLENGIKWLERGLEYEAAMRKRWAERWTGGDLSQAPKYNRLRENYARALQRAGRIDEAVAVLDEILEKHWHDIPVRQLKGIILAEAGRSKEAVEELMLLALMTPDHGEFLGSLGSALHSLAPGSAPVGRGPSGALRLDLDDPTVKAALAQAGARYLELLHQAGDTLGAERLKRTVRLFYDLELGG